MLSSAFVTGFLKGATNEAEHNEAQVYIACACYR